MKRVLIGMSGGVDSSVAALLLKKEGYEVIGVTMILFEDPNISVGCLSNEAVKDAKKVCDALKIEHHILELKEEFKCKVIDNFINCYEKGETPNPCVECNKFLKFGALYEKAKELNCEYIATGHYASIKDGKLTKSKEIHKDQSYFLYGIKKEVLSHIIFPLENFDSKEEIRKIAEENNLIVARKKESQEIIELRKLIKAVNQEKNEALMNGDFEIVDDLEKRENINSVSLLSNSKLNLEGVV